MDINKARIFADSPGIRLTSFGKVLRGFGEVFDAKDLAEQIHDHLAWMMIAGSCNDDIPDDAMRVDVDSLYRAYPVLEECRRASTLDASEKLLADAIANQVRCHGNGYVAEVRRVSDELNALIDMVGRVNEKVIGAPLRCCTFKPNCLHTDGTHNDVWESVWAMPKNDEAIRTNHLLRKAQRAGGRCHFYQWVCFTHETCKLHVAKAFVQEFAPNQYYVIDSGHKIVGNNACRYIDEAYAIALSRRYNWEVEFALSKSRTGLVVTTDAEGVKDMLATRERAPRGRREALIHWVREHHRRRRVSPTNDTDMAFVRAHMRGKVECEYGGMWCRIYPSAYDLDRACNGERVKAKLPA